MPRDPASLLGKVMRDLEGDGALNRTLATAPVLYGTNEHPILTNREAMAKFVEARLRDIGDSTIENVANEIVEAIHQQAAADLVNQKRDEFKYTERNSFVLAESQWLIARPAEAAEVTLTLVQFQPPDEGYDRPDQSLAIPSGLGIRASCDTAGLTSRGTRLLKDGETQQLGVFGTTQQFDEATGHLNLSAIVIFARAEARRSLI